MDQSRVTATRSVAEDSPLCVLQTWNACFQWQDPKICALASVENMKFDQFWVKPTGADLEAKQPFPGEPWRVPLTHPGVVKADYIDMRITTLNRCVATKRENYKAVPEELIGTVEIMVTVISPSPEVHDWRESVFVSEREEGWRVVGFALNEPETCMDAPHEGDFMRYCDLYYFIPPWALEEEVRQQAENR